MLKYWNILVLVHSNSIRAKHFNGQIFSALPHLPLKYHSPVVLTTSPFFENIFASLGVSGLPNFSHSNFHLRCFVFVHAVAHAPLTPIPRS